MKKKNADKECPKIFETWNLKNAVTICTVRKENTHFLLNQCRLNPNFHESFVYVYVHNFHYITKWE